MALAGCRIFVSLPGTEACFEPPGGFPLAKLFEVGGAEQVTSPEEATHILIRSQTQDDHVQLKFHTMNNPGCVLVGLPWLFGSLLAKRPLDPAAHPLYSPFPAETIPGAAGYGSITQTGYSGIERAAVKALALTAGLNFKAEMPLPNASVSPTDGSTVLVLAKDVSRISQKADAARQHAIPVVHLGWLLECLEKWTVVDPIRFTHPPLKPATLIHDPPPPGSASVPAPAAAFHGTAVIADSEDEGMGDEEMEAKAETEPEKAVAAVEAAAPAGVEAAQEEEAAVDEQPRPRARVSSPGATDFFSAPSSKKAGTESDLSGAVGGAIMGTTQAMGMVGGLVGALCHETQMWMPAAPVSAAPKAASGGGGGGAGAAAGLHLFNAFKAGDDEDVKKEREKSPPAEPEPQEEEAPAAETGADADGDDEGDRSPSATPSQLSMGVKIPGGTVVDFDDAKKEEEKAVEEEKAAEAAVGAEGAEAVEAEKEPPAEEEVHPAPDFMSMPPVDDQGGEDFDVDFVGGGGHRGGGGDSDSDIGGDGGGSLGGGEDVEMEEEEKEAEAPAAAVEEKAAAPEEHAAEAPEAEPAMEEEAPKKAKGTAKKAVKGREKKKEEEKGEEGVAAAVAGRGKPRKQRGPARAPFSQVAVEEGADQEPAPEGRRTRRWRPSSEAVEKIAAAAVEEEEQPKTRGKRGRGKAAAAAAAAAAEEEKEVEKEEKKAPAAAVKGVKGRKRGPVAKAKAKSPEPEAMEEDEEEEEEKPQPAKKPAAKKATGRKRPAAAATAAAASEEPEEKKKKKKKEMPKKRAKVAAPAKTAPAAARRRARIALSGLHSEEQAAVAAQLAPIPSAVVVSGNQSHGWDASFTHVLAPRLLRNQKCLAALAAGAWIVAPSFADACEEAGRLVDEEPHELHAAGPSGVGTAEPGAAGFWRRRAEAVGGGAFAGLTVAVARTLAEPPSRADVCAILEAGGAVLVAVGGGEQADVVVATGAPQPAVQRQIEGGALLVEPLWVVDWVARPGAGLEEHVRGGRAGRGPLAAAAAARAAAAAEAGFGGLPEPQVSLSL